MVSDAVIYIVFEQKTQSHQGLYCYWISNPWYVILKSKVPENLFILDNVLGNKNLIQN